MEKVYKIAVDCPNCASVIERKVCKIEGVREANVSFMTQKLIVEFDTGVNEKEILNEILRVGKRIDGDFNIL